MPPAQPMRRLLLLASCLAFLLMLSVPALAAEWGLTFRDASGRAGAQVVGIVPGRPAAQGGIRPGDIIIEANGRAVGTGRDLLEIMNAVPPETPLWIRISRDGWEKRVQLEPPKEAVGDPGARKWLGMMFADQPRDAPPGHGARITEVTPGGPASRAGLQPADIITRCEGREIEQAEDLGEITRAVPSGRALSLVVVRGDWEKEITLTPEVKPEAGRAPEGWNIPPQFPGQLQQGFLPPPDSPQPPRQEAGRALEPGGVPPQFIRPPQPQLPPPPPPPERLQPPKATVAVGDFQVRAANAGQFIGDGLREMLLTALHNQGSCIVVERIDIKGIAAEQALSRSPMARPDAAIPERRMDVADIMVYGTVTEFEAEAGGGGLQLGVGLFKMPFNIGLAQKEAHMAIDMRVVEVATGRVLVAQRIAGSAQSSQTSLGITPQFGNVSMPASFNSFKNTPMELAIRDCVERATASVVNNIPRQLFRHR